MFRDILCRLSGTNDITATYGGTPQDISAATTAGLLSTNYFDMGDGALFLGDGEPLFVRVSATETPDSATANATIDIEVIALPPTLTSVATFAITSASSGLITKAAHGLVNGQRVTMANSGGALPTNISAATSYFVISATTNTFRLAATPGGADVGATGGSGTNTITWFPTILGCMKGVPLERLAAGQFIDVPVGPQPYGNGVDIPAMKNLFVRYVPSASLDSTHGDVFADLIRGRSTSGSVGLSGFTMSNP